MKNNQHNDFDDFFRDKLNNRTFEFQEDFWQEMETLLPKENEENNKKVGGFLNWKKYAVSTVLLLLCAGGWFVYSSKNSEKMATIVKSNVQKQHLNLNKTTENSTEKDKSISTPAKNQDKVSEGNTIEIDRLLHPSKRIFVPKNNVEAQNRTVESDDKVVVFANKPTFEKENLMQVSSKNQVNFVQNTPNNEVKNTVKAENQADENHLSGLTNKENVEELAFFSKEKEIIATNFVFLNSKYESEVKSKSAFPKEIDSPEPTCDGCPYIPNLYRIEVDLIAGLSASQGFKNSFENRANPSYDPTVGLKLTFVPSPIAQWQWTAEPMYWSRSALNAQIGYDSTTYGFGVRTVSKKINIEELHYISLPIYATFTSKKHRFHGGITANYLLNAFSKTEGRGEELNIVSTEAFDVPTTTQWGYTAAFQKIDLGVALGYDYEVYRGWKVGARLNYGFMDVTKNDVFQNTSWDNHLTFRLFLSRNLWSFGK